MKQTIQFLLVFAAMVLALGSCKKEEMNISCAEHQDQTVAGKAQNLNTGNLSTNGPIVYDAGDAACGTPQVSNFYAGQHIHVGDITISNTETDLIVTVATTGGWMMGHTHVYVGTLAGMPTTGTGNPQIGQFPSNTAHSPMVTTYTYTYDLATLDPCFIVAVHAEVHLLDANGDIVQSETGWGNDTQTNTGGSWAGYIDYCVQECDPCEYTTESYNFYGGQTILVGSVDVTNDGSNLYVTYNTTGTWALSETHLYVGDLAGLPTNNANTPIPGQFPLATAHLSGTTSYTYTIPLASLNSSCIIIAAHASVVGSDNSGDEAQETAWSDGTPFPNSNRWGWFSNYCVQDCEGTGNGTSTIGGGPTTAQ